jgi:hypothetical protein
VHTPASPLGPPVIAVPVIGALVVAFLVQRSRPKPRGTAFPRSWMV